MDVPNDEWVLAGDGSDDSLVMQNVGDTRIGFVFGTAKPADAGINLETDEHFVLLPGSDALTITDLATYSRNVYVRSLGPKVGQLAVEANTAV